MLVLPKTFDSESSNLNFKVFRLTFANFTRLTAVKVVHPISWGFGGDMWSSDTPWCFMLLHSRYTLTVQALWLVLSYLLSHPWEGTTIEFKEGDGVESLYFFSCCFTLLQSR